MDVEVIKNTAAIQLEPVNAAKTVSKKNSTAPTFRAAKEEHGKSLLIGEDNSQTAGKSAENEKDMETMSEEAAAKRLSDAVSLANNKIKQARTGCEFGYDETTNRVTIKVVDKDTHEVIKEIPPEKTLKMVEKLWEVAGILVDERG